MNDHIVRALSNAGGIRALACTSADLTREICTLQQASLTVRVALGRALAGGALMGALLKPGQRVALKFEGNGPMGKLIVEADSDGLVRGTVGNPLAEAEPIKDRWNVPGILGKAGFLTVTKDLGLGGEPYRGMVQLRTSEIGDDLAYYLTDSEQVPSAVGLGVSLDDGGQIKMSGGFLVQSLPMADEAEIKTVMNRITSLPPITKLLSEGGPDLLLASIFDQIPYTKLESHDLSFSCGCSREKVERALLTLGHDALLNMAQSGKDTDVVCEFCRQAYHLDTSEIKLLMKHPSFASNF